MKKEAALSRIVEQRMNKEAVEAENAANNAKLAEHLVHVSALSASQDRDCKVISIPCFEPYASHSCLPFTA